MADPRDHLCLALDTADADRARAMAEAVGDAVMWHKVGSALAPARSAPDTALATVWSMSWNL